VIKLPKDAGVMAAFREESARFSGEWVPSVAEAEDPKGNTEEILNQLGSADVEQARCTVPLH
jgi:hypothetical protein